MKAEPVKVSHTKTSEQARRIKEQLERAKKDSNPMTKLDAALACADAVASRVRGDVSYDRDLQDDKPRVVIGVKGMKSSPFRKRFTNAATMDRWFDSDESGDVTVREVRADSTIDSIVAKAATTFSMNRGDRLDAVVAKADSVAARVDGDKEEEFRHKDSWSNASKKNRINLLYKAGMTDPMVETMSTMPWEDLSQAARHKLGKLI